MSILRQSLLGFLMFLIVMTMGHFVWGFIFEGTSPFMALAGNLWRPALWLLLHLGILVFVAYTTFHIWMMVRYGRTHKENNEWPPEEYTLPLDEGGERLKGSKRSDRRVGCFKAAFAFTVFAAAAMFVGHTGLAFMMATIFAWWVLLAPARLLMRKKPDFSAMAQQAKSKKNK